MSDKAHAIVGPSAAEQWFACTKSARLQEQLPRKSSKWADEGTRAHALSEFMLRAWLGLPSKEVIDVNAKNADGKELYPLEMIAHCKSYITFIKECVAEIRALDPDLILQTEEQVDLSKYIPDGFGTVDFRITSFKLGLIWIIDLKFGANKFVDAWFNKQTMCYAVGALEEALSMGVAEFKDVRMSIFQPRMDNISTFEMKAEALLHWAATEMADKAFLAFNDLGEFVAGPHCQFCGARARCEALRLYAAEAAKMDFLPPGLANDADLVKMFNASKVIINYLNALKDHMTHEAVANGYEYPGLKLVRGMSRRTYKDPQIIMDQLAVDGYDTSEYLKSTLIGIVELENLVGKPYLSKSLAGLVIKPKGAPTLVPIADHRKPMDRTAEALAEFAEFSESEPSDD